MFLEEEKDVVETEEVKDAEIVEEKKEENTNNNGGTKYHLIRENFNKALIWAIIGLGIQTVVWILTAIFGTAIDGNVVNIIQCIILAAGCAGMVFVGIVELKLFLNKTNPKHTEDIASFIISLVAFILAFLTVGWWAFDSIDSLISFFRGL